MKKWIAGIFALLSIIFLVLILINAPDPEVAWFIVPLGGLYRMIQGTWWKAVGRFLSPALPVVPILLLGGFSFWLAAIYATYLLMKTLPFTLIGNSVHDNPINWVWIWVLGFINGLACLSLLTIFGFGSWITAVLLSLVPMAFYGVCGTLSNVKATAKFFPWKLCEFVFGASAMVPSAMLINHFYGGIL